ncbi:bifunctional hydroxy-methylpyrimidine kinase/ hydroxy-phosphomethylpyrimidine kinase [Salinisphaera sp. PC39]|uniref:bifunctional hydroxymethylpyrimidine kinase/phosphomethylpyrimidine kinase n=1 Tax=Salinisphaera sp. PC39 TaxID=1304156 RepID=UPI003340988B
MNTRPNVLCLSGHDPSGGAGIQADIEAVAAQGAHAAVVVTCLTRQDTHNAYSVTPLDDAEFEAQIRTLEADMRFAAFKVGLVGSPGQVDAIAALASRHPDVPLVVDPVLRAGGGATLAADPIARALKERLFGHALCLTPNAAEATLLCDGETDPDTCGARLSTGHTRVLLTGGDLPGDEIVNRLYRGGECVARQTCTRLPGRFHGSGCTLASALAARLAQGEDVTSAADAAQDYTWRCLKNAFQAGTGQLIPDRCRRFR